jgi:hypothetical protein
MKANEHARIILNTEPVGKQEHGRPRMRWIDGVVEDLGLLGCRNWRMIVQDRNEW